MKIIIIPIPANFKIKTDKIIAYYIFNMKHKQGKVLSNSDTEMLIAKALDIPNAYLITEKKVL